MMALLITHLLMGKPAEKGFPASVYRRNSGPGSLFAGWVMTTLSDFDFDYYLRTIKNVPADALFIIANAEIQAVLLGGYSRCAVFGG